MPLFVFSVPSFKINTGLFISLTIFGLKAQEETFVYAGKKSIGDFVSFVDKDLVFA